MSRNVSIFIFCYNEQLLLPHTIAHYKRLLPLCQITILDNKSTDDSVNIARSLGCKIHSFSTDGQDEYLHQNMRNILWKKNIKKWIIFIDMDEWLYINEEDLINEDNNGTTILSIKGYNVVGDSKEENCSDINFHTLSTGYFSQDMSKNVCFKAGQIKEMNFSVGGHACNPLGNIKFSDKYYILKHIDYPGLPFKLNKQRNRFLRSEKARQLGMDVHYAIPLQTIIDEHDNLFKNAENFYDLIKQYI